MVQKKMAKSCSTKLSNQANNTLKVEKKQAIIKPSLQNHDGKSKVADLKAIKMKKSRSIKRCNVEMSLQSSQPVVAPAYTPSPRKALQCKSPYTSPNYMKSTSSSEARKEKSSKLSDSLSTSKLHRVAKTVTKTCSSMKRVRSLTQPPSFKHTRSGSCKKMVLCQTDLEVQKATCSSTMKDSKFPSYLELKSGATEAEGNSVFKVCPYSYCSLNGHHHISAPPLKRFLFSRRRLLKTLKVRPDVLLPRKVKPAECAKANGGGDQVEDFFVQVYAPDKEFAAQVSESLLDRQCSETVFEDDFEQTEFTHLSGMNFSPENGDYLPNVIQKQTSFESLTHSLDEYFDMNSDMEWEEGQSPAAHDDCKTNVQTDYSKDQGNTRFQLNNSASRHLEFITDDHDKPGFKLNNSASKYVEFLAEEYTTNFHDEIMEYQQFSDTESLSESASTYTGDKHIEQLLMVADEMDSVLYNDITEYSYLAEEAFTCAAKLEDESMLENERIFAETPEWTTEAPKGEKYTAGESKAAEDAANLFMKERETIEETIKHAPSITDDLKICSSNEKICMADNNDQLETVLCQSGNEAKYCVSRRTENPEEEEEEQPYKIPLPANESNDLEGKTSGRKDLKRTGLDSNNGESSSDLELLDSCSKLTRVLRCRKAEKDIGEDRKFNPQGPNFLAVDPEPEAEKVDLRHQEMDERRNAEEWMLDHALQKTVNQLAPARKKKVALLVEAFESVLPIPKCESHRRRSSPGFTHARAIQACS